MTIPQFVAGSVLEAAQLNVIVDALNAGGGKMEVQQFTTSGTFTVPAGVTHAVAHITGGGGGIGNQGSPGAGGNSSVAFAGGTITATGGAASLTAGDPITGATVAGATNSGYGANCIAGGTAQVHAKAGDAAIIVAGAAVTPAASITVTVGAGGVAGTFGAAGGSGYVWIEYQA